MIRSTVASSCFLCLQDPALPPAHSSLNFEGIGIIKTEEVEEEFPSPQGLLQPISLGVICRYLELHKPAISPPGIQPVDKEKIFGIVRNSPGSVLMCQNCAGVATQFSDLCDQFELLQMKVDYALKQFYDRLTTPGVDVDEDESWNGSESQVDQVERDTMRIFRRKAIEKCKTRLRSIKCPIVKIRKIKMRSSQPIAFVIKEFPVIHVKDEPSQLEEDCTDYSMDAIEDELLSFACDPFQHLPVNSLLPPISSNKDIGTEEDETKTCYICPNLPTFSTAFQLQAHQEIFHPDNLLASSRLEHITPSQFKEYCDHVLHIEGLVCKQRPETNASCAVFRGKGIQPARYSCQYCSTPVGFSAWKSLRRHLFGQHEGILVGKVVELQQSTSPAELKVVRLPPLRDDSKCQDCGAKFAQADSLARHLKMSCVHRDDKSVSSSKPCKCPECGQIFSHLSTFYNHRKKKHPKKPDMPAIIL